MIFYCSVGGDAESFVSKHVDCFVIGDVEGSVTVGIGNSVAEGFCSLELKVLGVHSG